MTPTVDSTPETPVQQIARSLIEDGAEIWHLSDNDRAAIDLILRQRFTLLAALKALVAAVEARDNGWGVSSHAEVMSIARHYIAKAEGR